MEINNNIDHYLDEWMPKTWDRKMAKIISDVLSPPVITLLGTILFAFYLGTSQALLWTGLYLVIVLFIPVGYIIYLVKKGKVTDFHLRVREERFKPLLVIIGCSIVGWTMVLLSPAPYQLKAVSGIGVLQILVIFLITTKWKISGHSSAISSFTLMVYGLFGATTITLPVFLAVPLVAWARVRIKRHTLMQTIAGTVMGALFMGAMLYIIAQRCGGTGLACY